MALFTLLTGGVLFDVLEGSLTLPIDGVPTATLELPEDAAPPIGEARVLIGESDASMVEFVGTLTFARPNEGRVLASWVGGAGAFGEPSTEVHYVSVSQPVEISTVVERLIADAGEVLAAGALDTLVGFTLTKWTRAAGETWAKALSRVLENTDRRWRVLDTGEVWIGAETWPAANLGGQVLDEDVDARAVLVGFDTATLRPGSALADGRQVVGVTFYSTGTAEVRVDDAATLRGFAAAVQAHLTVDPYARTYLATVVRQNADQTLDLEVSDADAGLLQLPVSELTNVPFDSGVQGARFVLPKGAQVRVGFIAASPAGARAFGRPTNGAAARGVARKNDLVDCGTLTIAGVANGLSFVYTSPGGGSTSGLITAQAGNVPVVFVGQASLPIQGKIVSASEEVFLT